MYSRYPAYRTESFDLLNEVPEHWELRRMKFNVSKVGSGITPKGGAESYEAEGIPLLRSQNVHFNGLRLDDVVFIDEETHAQMGNSQVLPGDVLLNITGASIGRCFYVDESLGHANVNQHVCIIRPEPGLLTRFLFYVLSSELGQQQIKIEQGGSGREGLNFVSLKNFSIPFLPKENQQKIANFLDWKTGQIDALIAKKKLLIEKLQEQRSAVITQSVTKGLNPDVPKRDTGIPWLGEVPEHWELMKLHHIVRMKSGESITSADIEEVGSYPVFGGNGIRGFTDQFTHDGEFVLIGRQGAWCGNINYATGYFWASEHAVVAKPDRKFSTVWLGETLRAMNLNQYSESAAQPGLSVEAIGRLKLPFPPYDDQIEIARHIKERTEKIDELAIVTSETIDRLTEYRTALITAATTGKIDVRGMKIPS